MKFFDELISRIVSLPIESFDENAEDKLEFFRENENFQLSLLIASRSLFDDIKKNKSEKIINSLDKYYSRAHFNPIPFGTFSSAGLLKWSSKTSIKKSESKELLLEYDNLYLTKKSTKLTNGNWSTFKYYTNPSLHYLNEEQLSFYKSEKLLTGNYETKYIEIDNDENVQWLTERFQNGENIQIVIDELIKDGFSQNEIYPFFEEIIQIGLILSESIFYPYRKPFYSLESTAKQNKPVTFKIGKKEEYKKFTDYLIKAQNDILCNEEKKSKYLFSISSYESKQDSVGTNVKEKLTEFVHFSIAQNSNHTPINDSLSKFGSTFYHLHQDKFVALGKAFNPYSGLEYNTSEASSIKIPEEIISNILTSENNDVHLPLVNAVTLESNINERLPTTFNVIFELLTCKKTSKEIIYCKYITGASALPLLARFNHVSNDLCEQIAKFEKEVFKDFIIAEINLFSKPRANNIVANHQYYDYNIPLNTIYKDDSNPIFLSDLFLAYDGTKFILKSKKHKRIIIPRITSAVNTAISDSEIYKFLADLQYQSNELYSLSFNLNYHRNMYISYVPRIYLGDDILLSPAQLLLSDCNFSLNEFKDYFIKSIEQHSFSRKILFYDGNGEINIDIKNQDHLKLLFDKIKKLGHIYVTEVLYETFDSQIKNNKSQHYAHEIVANVKNSTFKELKDTTFLSEVGEAEIEHMPFKDNWLYFDLYCNTYGQNDILISIYEHILSKYKNILFFFVRYDYPENHLRVRFCIDNLTIKTEILSIISRLKSNSRLSRYVIIPYEPEVQRYGGQKLMALTEKVFSLDSIHTLQQLLTSTLNDNLLFCFAIYKIQSYLKHFKMSEEQMIVFCEMSIQSFSKEFVPSTKRKKEMSKVFNELKHELSENNFNELIINVPIISEVEKGNLFQFDYLTDLIHMSLNRVFDNNQRLNEYKSYVLAKKHINSLKYLRAASTNKKI